MKTNNSSFKSLPVQIEWVLPLLIFFNAYSLYFKDEPIEIIIGVLTFFILLNGWISSKATSTLYSDSLLTIDVITLCVYFLMVLSFNRSETLVNDKYWLFSSLICICYGFWDIRIKSLISRDIWKKYYYKYIFYMFISAMLFFTIFLVGKYSGLSHIYTSIAGITIWVINLFKWHYDKTKKVK